MREPPLQEWRACVLSNPLGALTAHAVDEDAPHRLGRHGEKVGAILKLPIPGANQTQPDLVDERRRLERLAGESPATF
jgi:hypothetical protein